MISRPIFIEHSKIKPPTKSRFHPNPYPPSPSSSLLFRNTWHIKRFHSTPEADLSLLYPHLPGQNPQVDGASDGGKLHCTGIARCYSRGPVAATKWSNHVAGSSATPQPPPNWAMEDWESQLAVYRGHWFGRFPASLCGLAREGVRQWAVFIAVPPHSAFIPSIQLFSCVCIVRVCVPAGFSFFVPCGSVLRPVVPVETLSGEISLQCFGRKKIIAF